MSHSRLQEIGFRWSKPTWERTADRSMVFVVPSPYVERQNRSLSEEDEGFFDRTLRYYQIFDADGSFVNEYHEVDVEKLLIAENWRQMPASMPRCPVSEAA